jgi:hypothetical protein
MKYLCLIYDDAKRLDAMPAHESQAFIDEHLDYDEALKRSGHFIASEALEPGEAAAVVRVRNGRLSTIDGPFVETKEQLGGFYLIEARDLNEAIQIAGKIPSARTGSVEVRPVCELTHS